MSALSAPMALGTRARAAGLWTVGLAASALVLAAVIAYGLAAKPAYDTLGIAGAVAAVLVLLAALARYDAVAGLGFLLLAIVKFEPAPTDAIFLVLILVSALLGTFTGRRLPFSIAAILGAYLAVNLFGLSSTIDTARALKFSFITFYLALFAIWLTSWADRPSRTRILVRWYVVAATVSAALGTLAVLTPVPLRGTLSEYGASRAVGFFKDPNVFGAFLVPAALIVVDELLAPRLLRSRGVTKIATFLLLAVGVVFSFSRAAWINLTLGLLTMIGVYALQRGGARRAARMVTAVLAGACAVGVVLAATGSIGFLQQRAHLQGYDSERFGAQSEGIRLVEHHPFGIGPGQFELYSSVSVHSTYVRALAELGLLGLALVAALLLTTLVLGTRNAVAGRTTAGIGPSPLLGAWVGILVSGFVIDTLHWRHLWLVAGLIWAGARSPRGAMPR